MDSMNCWNGINAGIDFLEFRPSEIAAAVALCISGEVMQGVDIEKAISCFTHVEKVKRLFQRCKAINDRTNLLLLLRKGVLFNLIFYLVVEAFMFVGYAGKSVEMC